MNQDWLSATPSSGGARTQFEPSHPIPGSFVRRLALYGVVVEISAPRALAPWLAIVLRAYPPAPAGAATDIRIVVKREDQMWRFDENEGSSREWYPETPKAGIAALQVEWLVVSEALKRWTSFVHVHAALVSTPSQSALLVGRSGSGKSTTSVALALAGLELYTDDVALLDRTTMRPVCLPRPVKLDHLARSLLRNRGLVVPRGASIRESIDRTALPGLPPIGVLGPPLTTMLFFAGERSDRAVVRPITGAEAVMRLVVESVSERFDDSGPSEGAIALINAVQCYELVPGTIDSTVRAVLDLLHAGDKRAVGKTGNLAGAFVA